MDAGLQALAGACDMFTGAELAGLCREAAITALREDIQVQCTSAIGCSFWSGMQVLQSVLRFVADWIACSWRFAHLYAHAQKHLTTLFQRQALCAVSTFHKGFCYLVVLSCACLQLCLWCGSCAHCAATLCREQTRWQLVTLLLQD